MSGTQAIIVGNKGRIVVPAEIRARRHWEEGTALVAVETEAGVLLTDREEAERLVRRLLAGGDLVADLLADRRSEAAAEDAEA